MELLTTTPRRVAARTSHHSYPLAAIASAFSDGWREKEGYLTLAINRADGVRVRNLVGAEKKAAGKQTIAWDGLDDDGRLLPPGKYHWVGLLRGELHAVYRGAFSHGNPPWFAGSTGGWGPDHSMISSVTAVGDQMILGGPVREWGHGLLACDLSGTKLWGQNTLYQGSFTCVHSLVSDGERVFATAPEGCLAGGEHRVWEIDPHSGKNWWVAGIPVSATGAATQPSQVAARGIRIIGMRHTGPTRWDGELYVSDVYGDKEQTFVFSMDRNPEVKTDRGYDDKHLMKLLRVLPLRAWGMTWLPDGRCLATTLKGVFVLDTQSGKTTPFTEDKLGAPYGITSDKQGRVYVSDRTYQLRMFLHHLRNEPELCPYGQEGTMQVRVYDSGGKGLPKNNLFNFS
jgi:hypothetical protein